MSKFIRIFVLIIGVVSLFSSCKKDEDIEGGKPYPLAGTTWISRLSGNRGYDVYKFISRETYQRQTLDKNAILVESEPIGVYRLETSNGRRLIVFYDNRGFQVNSLFIDYNEGTMEGEGDVYWKQ
jgi:lipoprotein